MGMELPKGFEVVATKSGPFRNIKVYHKDTHWTDLVTILRTEESICEPASDWRFNMGSGGLQDGVSHVDALSARSVAIQYVLGVMKGEIPEPVYESP